MIVELTATGETVGSVGAGIGKHRGVAEIACALIPEYNRHGYASERSA